MAKDIREVLLLNEENEKSLYTRCDEVNFLEKNKEIRAVTKALKDTIRNKELVSLAANQIGESIRVFCVNFGDSEVKTFINPIISNVEGIQLSREKDISIPNKEYIRVRHPKVSIMYQSPDGKIQSREFLGKAACVIQQEIDHLDGVFLSDIGLELVEDWDSYPEEERQEVINEYLDSLDLISSQMQKEIEEDEDLSKALKEAEIIKKIQSGEITVTPVKEEE